MGRILRKGDRGIATQYITRNRAIRRLQVTLSDFRKLCILKGIYPREPRKKKKLKGRGKTYYHIKDIQYLSHESIIDKFREFRIYLKKVKRAMGRNDYHTAHHLKLRKPTYRLEHVVKERYPSLRDALRDLDDALSTIALFASLAQIAHVSVAVIDACKRLLAEFQLYLIQTRALRKVFLSIKGLYCQCCVEGEVVTWVAPHEFTTRRPADVDFRVMLTFVEFYINLIGFVNFHLYQKLNLTYPPKIPDRMAAPPHLHIHKAQNYLFKPDRYETLDRLNSLNHSIEAAGMDADREDVEDELDPELMSEDELSEEEAALKEAREREEKLTQAQKELFENCFFYLDREVSKSPLVFCIRSCGGSATWDGDTRYNIEVSDGDITHHVVDRSSQPKHRFLLREYFQPQWVFDSVNCRRRLPFEGYRPGDDLPPHLSPFMQEKEGDYIPPERLELIRYERETGENENSDDSLEDEKSGSDLSADEIGNNNQSADEIEKMVQSADEIENIRQSAGEIENIRQSAVETVPGDDVQKSAKKKKAKRKRGLRVGEVIQGQVEVSRQDESLEEDKLRAMLLTKKKRKLYDKLRDRDKKRSSRINKLRERRKLIDRKKTLAVKAAMNNY